MSDWIAFSGALTLFLLLVILPGYLIARSIGATRYLSAVAAAPISCTVFSLCGIVLFRLGFPGHIPLLACTFGLAILAMIGALVLNALKRRPAREAFLPRHFTSQHLDWRFAILYVGVGMAVIAILFLNYIGDPTNVNQMDDNVTHLTTIADMVNVGNYSMVDSSSYVGIVPDNQIINPSRSYYPEGFHILVSLLISLTGLPIGIAENAVIYGFVAILYPLGFSLFMQLAFPANRTVVMFGAFLTCACVMFPTRCLVANGFYPFTTGMALVPIALSLGVLSCAIHLSREARLRWFVLALLVFAGVACIHPSAFLAALAMLVPFIVLKLVPFLAKRSDTSAPLPRRRLIVYQLLALTGIAIIWLILYKLPFLSSLVSFEWDYHVSLRTALLYLATMALRLQIPAILLAILVFTGFVRAACSKQTLWLSASFAFIAFLYITTIAGSGTVKHVAGGFWYTDPERLSAMVAIVAVPLTACAFALIYEIVKKALRSLVPAKEHIGSKPLAFLVAACLLCGFCILDFAPVYNTYGKQQDTPFGVTTYQISMFFNGGNDYLVYSPEEEAFVKKVKEIIPENSTVLNFPADGSILAGPLNGLNVYYRTYNVGTNDNNDNSSVIRKSDSPLTTNPTTTKALDETGLEYILLLDNETLDEVDDLDSTVFGDLNKFTPRQWLGLLQITDDTPGLELVLSEGDMRLYKIENATTEE